MDGKILIYQNQEGNIKIDVRLQDDNIWLTQEQMATLFGKSKSTINEHIKNIFEEGELEKKVAVRDFRITTQHGAIAGKTQESKVNLYNLDVDIQFGYHNHNFEFEPLDGIVPYYDLFMPLLDADLVTMELDVFWASKAGQDPVEMFKKYPGRFQLLHIKDWRAQATASFEVQGDDMCSVGEGVIDFKSIMEARDVAGAKYIFVEDDNQGNGKPFEGIETSIKNLTTRFLNG